MMLASIRARMLFVALLPITVVVMAMVLVFWSGRVDDLDEAHEQRSWLIARHVALSSEFGLFTGNAESLKGMLEGIASEPEVAGVAVFDRTGAKVAFAGLDMPDTFDAARVPPAGDEDFGRRFELKVQPVVSTRLVLDDFFSSPEPDGVERSGSEERANPSGGSLGHVVLQISRSALEARQRRILEITALLGGFALAVGGVLAMRLGDTVTKPVMRVSNMIQRIGRGDFTSQIQVTARDPLYDMQVALNQMAQRLGWSREDLQRQIDHATMELREKKEEAEQANQAKSRFLAAASHDLRQPTHALGMYIARLGQLPMDSQMASLVRSLEASVLAMQDLLDSLLDLSRLESGAMPALPGPVSLVEVLDGLAPAFREMAEQKGLRWRIRKRDVWVHSDAPLLQRIVSNLIHNAVRYTQSGGVLVAFRLASSGRQVRLEVWDTGIGIAPADQTEIFKEFFQVGNPSRTRSLGLGLGLNIVQRGADLLGHTISVQSRPGVGTRFVLTMQRTDAAALQNLPKPESPTQLLEDFTGRSVMVVDDDPFVLAAVSGLLESWGCVVRAAADVDLALAAVATGGAPDLVISDFQLGHGLNGIELIEAIRSRAGCSIAACLMSGDTSPALLQASKSAELTVLHKPVRPAKLRNLLRRLLPS